LTDENEKHTVYLRSTAKNFRKHVANLEKDFPKLEAELNLPDLGDLLFSSILRISSSNTQIWTHFDTYHNFLIQLCGEKNVFLAEPACASILKLQTDSDKPDIANPFGVLKDLSEKAENDGLILKQLD